LPSDERRAHLRYTFVTTGSNPVVATIGVVPRAALLSDLCPAGVGLLTTDPPPIGSVVPVWLALPIGAPSRLVLLRVVYAEAETADLHRLGLCSLDDTSSAVLRDLLEAVNGRR
jgi:hypothetical protein